MTVSNEFRTILPVTARFYISELVNVPRVDEVVVDLHDVAASSHPDRLRIGVATRVETAHDHAKQVTLRLSRFGTRYFDEDIIQFVQLLESGVDRLLLSGCSQDEVVAAAELLDEVETRFPVARPIRLAVGLASPVDFRHLESICAISERVDHLVVDALAFMAGGENTKYRPSPLSLGRLRDTVSEVADRHHLDAIGGPAGPTDPPDSASYHSLLRDHGFVGGWICGD